MYLVTETPNALLSVSFMYASRPDGSPSTLFLTMFICLQFKVNDFERDDVSSDVSYVSGVKFTCYI